MSNNDEDMDMGFHDEEAAEDTTANTAWQTAWTKDFTLPVGDYIVIVSFMASNDIGYQGSHYRVQYENSIDIMPDVIVPIINDGEYIPCAAVMHINVAGAGAKTFDFDFKASALGGETAKIKNKRIAVLKVCL